MKNRRIWVAAATISVLLLSGCNAAGKNENLKAGMEQIAALEYDNALVSFEAARDAGEDERLISRGEGLAYMGKTMYAEAAQAFETALAGSDGRIGDMDFDINYLTSVSHVD